MTARMAAELRERSDALREQLEELLLDQPPELVTVALKGAVGALARFAELGPTDEGLGALDELRQALGRARDAGEGSPELTDILDESRGWADDLRRRALDRLVTPTRGVGPEALEAAVPFGASVGSPAIHEAGEAPAPEVLAKAKRWDEPPDLEALLADEPAAAPRAEPVEQARVLVKRLGRDAMEDVAILGGLRRSKDHERWTDARGFEARLLANLDALWSLDRPAHAESPRLGVPMALWAYVTEWSFPDWGRAFALSFALGCCSSETALRWVALAMRRSDPTVLDAYVEGLSLASSPALERTIVGELASDASGPVLEAWLRVAARRRVFDSSTMLPLLGHPDSRIQLAAATCLRSAPRELAVASLRGMLDGTTGAVAVAVADELASRGLPEGLELLRAVLREAVTARRDAGDAWTAARAVALAAEAKDESLVLAAAEALREGPCWLGWYGRPAHVDVLVPLLEAARAAGAEGHERALACERAIVRISGVDASVGTDALRAELSEAAPWRKHARSRFGKPFDVRLVVDELALPDTLQGDRRVLARELAAHTPGAPRLDVEGWILRQEADLSALRGG